MTTQEWKRLQELGKCYNAHLRPQRKEYTELLKKTERVHEHPELYDGPCACQMCQSYAD